ncbi:hypothetical protein Tco_0786263 [Tanacetum coccineum]
MSQHANDDLSQHLSDDEASYHEDASENGTATNKPKQQQQQLVPTTTTISNIKLPILKKEEYDIWVMEMEHYLEYINNDVWKVIHNGNSKKRISTRKDGVVRILPSVSAAEIHGFAYSTYTPSTSSNNIPEREVPAGFADEVIYSLFVKQSEDLDLLHEDLEQIDDLEIEEMDINWQIAMIVIQMKKFYKKTRRRGTNDGKKRDSFYQDQGAGKKEQNQNCLLTIDDDVVNWGEHTIEKANELYEKDENLKKYRRIGMKAVKEKEQLQKIVDSWKDSSKNLWKLVNSEEYFVDKPFEGSFGNPFKHSVEFESESISVPKEVSEFKSVTTNEKVMSEPKPKDVEPSCVTHVKTPRQPMKNQKTPKVNGKKWNEIMERELGEGYSFIKKKCFVCSSLSHLIRDCDFYEKKMARKAELKKQRVFNIGNRVAKPVWNNANRVNHANHFVPRPVQLNAVRPKSNSVMPNVNTVRQNVNSIRSNINTVRPKQPVPTSNSNSFSSVRPQVNKFNQRSNFSKSHSLVRSPIVRNTAKMPYAVKGNWGSAVKTSAGEADISPKGLEAAETLTKVLTQRTKTYTRKVKTGLRRKLDADEVNTGEGINTGFTDVNTAFEEINSGNESIIPSPKKGKREGKAVLKEKSQSKKKKRQKKQIRGRAKCFAKIDELELSETQKNMMDQVQEAAKYYIEEDWDSVRAKLEENRDLSSKVLSIDFSSDDFAKKMVELINEKKRLQGNNSKTGQLKKLKPDELKEEFDKCVEKITDVPDVTKDESVKREEEFKVQQPILRYNIRKSLARKGLQKNKFKSTRSNTEEDVEAYMDERVDEPSSKEFQMGSIPQGSAPAKIAKRQILKTGKKGAYQIIREDHTDVVYVNFQGLLNDLTRDDLKELYRLMMLKYGDSKLKKNMKEFLGGFKDHV